MSSDDWRAAQVALHLLRIDPSLGGLWVRARSGPVRDSLAQSLTILAPLTRLHPAMTDEALLGGLDITETLSQGRTIRKQGLLLGELTFLLAMAERTPTRMAALIAQALDAGAGPLIAFDEGVEADETLPDGLAERLAFRVDLEAVALNDTGPMPVFDPHPRPATHSANDLDQIATLSARLGIDSLRAPLFALRAAKAHAQLMGRSAVTTDDIEAAARLVLVHRATQFPEDAPDEAPQDQSDATPPSETETDVTQIPQDMVLEAIKALLPDDLLARVAARKARDARGSGTGASRTGNRRGRPLPSRPGKPDEPSRIDLMATLRAAAPWQTLRNATPRTGLRIRPDDLRLKRFEERSDRLLVFAVDASGSSALARLAEVKGAIELLLSEAYARRDHVSLVSFRGTEAETLLPPTRSLVQTKRRLAQMPGGGGTPLASGLAAALDLALQSRRRGMTPTICLLTDGRANVARDGSGDRTRAAQDAEETARAIRAQGVDALVIDTGTRPERRLKSLAEILQAPYLPLPRADSRRLSDSVTAALGD